MSRAIQFLDHPRFHRAAFHMAAAGGLAGIAAHVASLLEPRLGGPVSPLPLAAVTGAALIGAAPAETRGRGADLSLVVLGASAVAFAGAAVARGHLPAVAGAAIYAAALGLLFARGLAGRRFLLAAATGAAAALVARVVLGQIAAVAPGPAWFAAALAGAAFGCVAVVGTLGRTVALVARPGNDAEDVVARARALVDSRDLPGLAPGAREEMRAEVGRLGELAARWRDLDGQLASAPRPEALAARIADLDRRLEAASDPLAREQFEKARGEIVAQLGELDSIRNARERVLARMYHTLAALERRRLGAVGDEADAASRALLEVEAAAHDGRP